MEEKPYYFNDQRPNIKDGQWKYEIKMETFMMKPNPVVGEASGRTKQEAIRNAKEMVAGLNGLTERIANE